MYRDIIKNILIVVFFCTSLFSAGKQIQLNNGMWQALGFQGVYDLDEKSSTWESDYTRAIKDIADENITFIRGDISRNDNYYVGISNNISPEYLTDTSALYATIGLFAIKGQESRKTANFLILDGTNEHSLFFKTEVIKERVYHMPMYRMYVEGKDDIPTIRIDYQADYEGNLFRIKFGNEKESYISYFNSSKTYSNPADLYDEEEETIIKKGPIEAAIDFNISDNNVTLLEQNRFRIRNDEYEIGGDGISTFDSTIGDEVLIYHYAKEKWEIFNSDNVNIGSNDFEDFEPGKGYWIKANSLRAHQDGNKTKIGVITKSNSKLLNSEYYKNLRNGWNMVSFPDTYLRYATTGMYVPYSEMNNSSGVNIFFGQKGLNNISDINASRDMNISLTSNFVKSVTDAVQAVNAFVKLRELFYGEPIKARAFPVMGDTLGSQGIIIISNTRFEVNSSLVTTLTGAPLEPTVSGNYITSYGEYILGLELNDLSGSEINGSIDFFMPSSDNRKFNATGISANDINNTSDNKYSLITKVDIALQKSATYIGATTPTTTTKSYLIDFDFESNESKREYNESSSFSSLLIASGARFFVRDETYTKVYHIEHNGSMVIIGDNDEKLSSGTTAVGSTGIGIIDSINSRTSATNIIATPLGSNYFAITSSTKRNLDLLEDDKQTLFKDIKLHDLNIPKDTVHYTQGVVKKVYTFLNLLTPQISLVNLEYYSGSNASLPKNGLQALSIGSSNTTATGIDATSIGFYTDMSKGIGTYITTDNGFPSSSSDLKENSMWAIDFPSDGIIEKLATYGKEMTSITTMNFASDNKAYWSFIDLTKAPDTWYIKDGIDVQDIFHLYNQKAYWVNVRDKTFISDAKKQIDASKSVYQKQVLTHFDNTLDETIGATTNHIDHTLDVKFDKSFIDPTQNPYYDVVAIIAGEEFRMKYNGTGFQLRLNSSTINLREKNATQPYDPIILKVYDGLGNNLLETPEKHTYEIEYFKPTRPNLRWDDKGELIVKTDRGNSVEFYSEYVSDLAFERKNQQIKYNKLSKNTKLLGWKASDGDVKSLRVIARAKTTQNQSFYSDIRGFLYAPLKYGHVLSVSAKKGMPKVDLLPYSFIQEQQLTSVDDKGVFKKFDGLNGINNGVQLTLLKKSIDEGKDIRMVYYPIITDAGVREGDKRLTSFGGNYTMYLKISTPSDTEARPVAQITYIYGYAGKIFYIYYAGGLYQCKFAGSDKHNSDKNAYNLYSGTLGISFNDLGNEGNKIGFNLTKGAPTQPITSPSNASSSSVGGNGGSASSVPLP